MPLSLTSHMRAGSQASALDAVEAVGGEGQSDPRTHQPIWAGGSRLYQPYPRSHLHIFFILLLYHYHTRSSHLTLKTPHQPQKFSRQKLYK